MLAIIDNDSDLETRKKWWEGYQLYKEYSWDPNKIAKIKLNPGDIVLTDNWRVTHGREAFKEGTGSGTSLIFR